MYREACPLCGQVRSTTLLDSVSVPVFVGVQYESVGEAVECPKGVVRLALCGDCGMIWNDRFEPNMAAYDLDYDNALDYSEIYQEYAERLARRLVDTYDIRSRRVVELGCGSGAFLSRLCTLGGNRGVGIDPSLRVGAAAPDGSGDVRFVRGTYHEDAEADLLCCRHVLEHIADPVSFLQAVRRILSGPDSVAYFEVPNARFVMEESVWDVIYEHCSYFTESSLARLFERCGFEILRLQETYGGQFLSVDVRATSGERATSDARALRVVSNDAAFAFRDAMRERVGVWSKRLREYESRGLRVVVWGAGAKAVTFLNLVDEASAVAGVVDINPNKQNRHIAGTGQPIVSPAFLAELQPEIVILMNAIYDAEVRRALAENGLEPSVIQA